MSKPFDPRKILKRINNSLLKDFFDLHGGLSEVPWDELREHQMEPVYAAWQVMPEATRRQVHIILHDINQLADDRGMNVLVEEMRCSIPVDYEEFEALSGQADRAMWAYLNSRNAFSIAAQIAHAEALSTGRYWVIRNELPQQMIEVKDTLRLALQEGLSQFHWDRQMRGKHCVVEYYDRANGDQYFFAYLDDYPDKQLIFDDSGHMVPREDRRAFEHVFVYSPAQGSLEMFARGGKPVYGPLQQIFCKSTLGIDVDPADPVRPAYTLDHLLLPNRALPTDPLDRIASVTITRVRLQPIDAAGDHIELGLDPNRGVHHIDHAIAEYLNTKRLSPGRVRVKQMSFKLMFTPDGPARSLSFNVTCPSTSDLKSKPDELRTIGERCLRLWEVTSE
jgi:hypothetical protein